MKDETPRSSSCRAIFNTGTDHSCDSFQIEPVAHYSSRPFLVSPLSSISLHRNISFQNLSVQFLQKKHLHTSRVSLIVHKYFRQLAKVAGLHTGMSNACCCVWSVSLKPSRIGNTSQEMPVAVRTIHVTRCDTVFQKSPNITFVQYFYRISTPQFRPVHRV